MITKEALAEYAHDAWSGWMKHLFQKSKINDDGTATIPKWAVERWVRQMNTPYTKLSQTEKDSDIKEANEILYIVINASRGK